MTTRFVVSTVTLCLLILPGCSNEPKVGDVIGTAEDPITLVAADDPEMAATVTRSQETIAEFIAALEEPPANASSFAVKKKFVEGDESEFMWLTGVTFADGTFTGTLDNDPNMVTNAKIGEQYSVTVDEVQDWLYFEGDEMKGGYSVKLLQQRFEEN
jgi:uncharacterized protein YegJ (DUF2314 family)